jgi:hypothetical protein
MRDLGVVDRLGEVVGEGGGARVEFEREVHAEALAEAGLFGEGAVVAPGADTRDFDDVGHGGRQKAKGGRHNAQVASLRSAIPFADSKTGGDGRRSRPTSAFCLPPFAFPDREGFFLATPGRALDASQLF